MHLQQGVASQYHARLDPQEITERVERLFESVGQATSRDGRIRNKTIVAAINSAHGMPDVEVRTLAAAYTYVCK